MASTSYFFVFLCLAVLSSVALTQGAPSGESLQLQATPLRGKVAPRDDSSDTVLRRQKRNQLIYFYFYTPKPNVPMYDNVVPFGAEKPPCDKFACLSSRREGRDRNLATCRSGFRFDRRSRTCRRLVGSG